MQSVLIQLRRVVSHRVGSHSKLIASQEAVNGGSLRRASQSAATVDEGLHLFGLHHSAATRPTSYPPASPAVVFQRPATDVTPADVAEKLRQWEESVDLSRLDEDDREVHDVHLAAVKRQEDHYVDPVTGYQVFTILHHLQKGYCCGNLCRHCAYNHANVQERYKTLRNYNTAFYN